MAKHQCPGEQKILCAADKEGNQEWVSEQERKQNGTSRNTEISRLLVQRWRSKVKVNACSALVNAHVCHTPALLQLHRGTLGVPALQQKLETVFQNPTQKFKILSLLFYITSYSILLLVWAVEGLIAVLGLLSFPFPLYILLRPLFYFCSFHADASTSFISRLIL